MKYCEQCGQEVQEGQNFCAACGAPTQGKQQNEGSQQPYGAQQQDRNQQGYGAQQPYSAQQQTYGSWNTPQTHVDNRQTSGMGVAALVCSIVGICLLMVVIGVILGVLAIIFGGICISKCNEQPNELKGKGLGTAGLVIGIITVGLFVLFLISGALAFHLTFY